MTIVDTDRRPLAAHIWQKAELGFYIEPIWCSQRLFAVEKFAGTIWDPACGTGRIPDAALRAGYPIRATDIVDRGYERFDGEIDFLRCESRAANIVCNPPFDICDEFVRHALKLATSRVAMIWLARRLNAARWLMDTPLTRSKTIDAARPRHCGRRETWRRSTGLRLVSLGTLPCWAAGIALALSRREPTMKYLGIDPGIAGAAAIVEIVDGVDGTAPKLIDVIDIPVVGAAAKTRVDAIGLRNWIETHSPDFAGVERAGSMPRQGISSAFKFGRATGVVEAVVACCGIPMVLVESAAELIDRV